MKSLVITTAIFILFSISGQTVTARSIVKETESFTISLNDNFEQSNNFKKSWIITYGDDNKTIEVLKNLTKNGEEYIVKNQFFEVRYTNTSKGFGVKKMKGNQIEVDPVITEAVINAKEMHNQSMLSPNQLSEEKALNYIASFVPFLLNENYQYLLN